MLGRDFRAELIRKYARSPEDDELLARLLDKVDAWERTGLMQATRFLSERDRLCCEPVLRVLNAPALFWGGYREAERVLLILPAEWQDPENIASWPDSPVSVLRAEYRAGESLSRDMEETLKLAAGCGCASVLCEGLSEKDKIIEMTSLIEINDI